MPENEKDKESYRVKNGKKGAETRIRNIANRKRQEELAKMSSMIDEDESESQPEPIDGMKLIDVLTGNIDSGIASRIRAYHRKIGDPLDWNAAEKIEKVVGEAIKNHGNQIELDRTRGRLIDRKELKTAVHIIREAWWNEVQQIGNRVLLLISDLSNEDRARVKNAIKKEVAICAERAKTRALEFIP
jgi:hypothetical protein